MMQAVAGMDDFSTLTIEHFAARVKAEHEVLKQGMKKVAMDHHEEAAEISFVSLCTVVRPQKTKMRIKR